MSVLSFLSGFSAGMVAGPPLQQAEIGDPLREIEIQPVEEPVPSTVPQEEPAEAPSAPAREPARVPA
jgi:hypothetical protein